MFIPGPVEHMRLHNGLFVPRAVVEECLWAFPQEHSPRLFFWTDSKGHLRSARSIGGGADGYVYTATANGSITNSKNNLIQYKGSNSAAKGGFKLLAGWIEAGANGGLTTAQGQRVQLIDCAVANVATSMTSNTPLANNRGQSGTLQGTVTTWATGQTDATSTTIMEEHGIDQRMGAGGIWIWQPKQLWTEPNGNAIIFNFPGAIQATTTLSYGMCVEEL